MAGTTARTRAKHVGFHNRGGHHWSRSGVQNARKRPLVAFWRPNPSRLSLLFSVHDARKLLINFAWGARGPGFKSRRPDQSSQILTDTNLLTHPVSGPNLGPNRVHAVAGSWCSCTLDGPVRNGLIHDHLGVTGPVGTCFGDSSARESREEKSGLLIWMSPRPHCRMDRPARKNRNSTGRQRTILSSTLWRGQFLDDKPPRIRISRRGPVHDRRFRGSDGPQSLGGTEVSSSVFSSDRAGHPATEHVCR
jgi:hypothetical protein